MQRTVLFLTSSYPKWVGEPSGIFLHHLAKELKALGWRVLVLAPNFPGGAKHEDLEGVSVHRFNYFVTGWQRLCYRSGMLPNLRQSRWLWLQVPPYFASMAWHAVQLLRKERVDLINAHWVLPQGLVASLVTWYARSPLVVTVHGSDVTGFSGIVGSFLRGMGLRKAAACTANSAFTKQEILKYALPMPVEVIPMGVDTRLFEANDRLFRIRQQFKVEAEFLLYVGRLVEQKGPQYLLEAMPVVLKRFPQAVLVLIGDGAQRQQLERTAQDLGISGSVRFLGQLPHSDLPDFYSAADVFVGPSLNEGLGIVFLEAAASGLAIVGTAVGGAADILIDGVTGIEVERASSEQLAQAIVRSLENPQLRRTMAQNARQHVEQHYSWRQVAVQFSALFDEVLCRHERGVA